MEYKNTYVHTENGT